MSSTLYAEIIRYRQQEFVTRATHARNAGDASVQVRRHRAIKRRLAAALAALTAAGLSIPVANAASVSADASQSAAPVGYTATAGVLSRPHDAASRGTGTDSTRFAANVRKLERDGYVQWLCTRTGMLMHNTHTGRFTTVRW